MKFKLIILSFIFLAYSSVAQLGVAKPSDCYGAMVILNPGTFDLDLTGSGGDVDDLVSYRIAMKDCKERNSVWAEFTAPFDGVFSFTASSKETFINAIIFTGNERDMCGKIASGAIEIDRFLRNETYQEIGLGRPTGDGYMYPITLNKGDVLYMVIFTMDPKRHRVQLNVKYSPLSLEEASKDLMKVMDFHSKLEFPALSVSLRDASNGLPVNGQLVYRSSKTKEAMYKGTDFIFDFEKTGRISISVDAEGYFFHDREVVLTEHTDQEIVVWLEPLTPGKQIEIKGIEFVMGSTEFAAGTEAKLRRLRDFLLLNSDIRIEIQGHVHEVGEMSSAGKKVSTARAKRVMNYLIENGVDKKRLEAVGYGNEFMIYPEPKFAHEEQANRRVEIKILQMTEN
jgi:outer membrane protein OmpA-like peptidoglycan-associated protein